jgi:hypothetical protein
LIEPREPRLILDLVYDSQDCSEEFDQKWCCRPVGLSGVRIQAREWSGDILAGALDAGIITALAAQFLPILIIPPDLVGAMYSRLRGTDLWSRKLTVCFQDGSAQDGYRAFLGTAAYHAHAELRGHFLLRERLKARAIIL